MASYSWPRIILRIRTRRPESSRGKCSSRSSGMRRNWPMGESARAPRPRRIRLPKLGHRHFKLELPLGIGIIRAADENRLAHDQQGTAGDLDLANDGGS